MSSRRQFLCGVCFGLLAAGRALAGADIGVVVLHGTQGMPGTVVTARFEAALRSAGYLVQAPEMCWSRNRIYDAAFPDCQRDIDAAIAKLHAAGARRIVVAGQSEGANAALCYAASHGGLAGVIALAPAGNPFSLAHDPRVRQSVAEAQQMAASGHGNDRAAFTNSNNGNDFVVNTTATIFLSFTDPEGPAAFARILPKVTVAVLWVASSGDRTQASADAQFATLPPNVHNRLVPVRGPHLGTPDAAVAPALEWLKLL